MKMKHTKIYKLHYILQVDALRWLICRCWGAPGLKWYIHNDLQLVIAGFIHIQEAHSGQDWRTQLRMISNHRPGKPQQWKLHLCKKYPSRVPASDSPGCRSEVCQNVNDRPANAAALPRISEPMSYILTEVLNIACSGFIHKWDSRICSAGSVTEKCPRFSGAPELQP